MTDRLDLLFVIDSTSTMARSQAALIAQFPWLFQTLATGARSSDGRATFPPARDIHIGVISSDMGTVGTAGVPGCAMDGDDDARLQHSPRRNGCDAEYPSFLTYQESANDPMKVAESAACIAELGTQGCTFSQPLEATLKALWPRVYRDALGDIQPNPISFLSTKLEGIVGYGDLPAAQGGNLGFLRADPSLLAVVMLTDKDDCSAHSPDLFVPANTLPDDAPLKAEVDLTLRCSNHPELLYKVRERYAENLQRLRPGQENKVVFAVIAGIPSGLVSADQLPNFANDFARADFYERILNDPAMQQRPGADVGTGHGNLVPSCSRTIAGEATPQVAYPPRRLVELAREFGPNGIVQSICQDDLKPALQPIVDRIGAQLGEACFPRRLKRLSSGKVPCDVLWELPPEAAPGSGVPTHCSDRPFLSPLDTLVVRNARGGETCKVTQLAATPPTKPATWEDGWYYDDFSPELATTCDQALGYQRIAFTPSASPGEGVRVVLDCAQDSVMF